MRVEQLVDRAADARPDYPALLFADRSYTYAQLRTEMDRRAARLIEAGLPSGGIVATTAFVSDNLALAMLACCRADCALMHFSAKMTAAELQPLVAITRPLYVLTEGGAPHPSFSGLPALPLDLPGMPTDEAYAEAHRRSTTGTDASVACLQTTSGATNGQSRLVQMPHRFFTWMADNPPWWQTSDAVYYFPRPTLLPSRTVAEVFAVGGTMALSVATRPATIEEEMLHYGATTLWTTPAIIRLLAEHSSTLSRQITLQYVRFGGAPLSADVGRMIVQRYGAILLNEYGSTEGGSIIGTPRSGAPEGSLGIPYPGIAARIVDEDGNDVPAGEIGELLVRTPAIMRGYVGDPDATAQALRGGWLWTGDLACRDTEGCYFLVGRKALRINVDGAKVSPEEVEAVLERHPGVGEAIVLAMPDVARGEVVRAVIVPRDPPPTAGELRRFCHERLAGYKVPRRFEFRDDLPRSPLGKVLRNQL